MKQKVLRRLAQRKIFCSLSCVGANKRVQKKNVIAFKISMTTPKQLGRPENYLR